MKARLAYFFGLVAVILAAADFQRALQSTQFFIFQTRDLYRASLVAAGQLIFYGPEVTGGGTLPGGLYYYLLALPHLLNRGWEPAWFLMAAGFVGAGLIGAYYLRARVSGLAGLIFAGVFASATLTRVFLRVFLNVSYLAIFAMGALVLVAESVISQDPRGRRRAFWGACFLLGLGVQLHFSVVVWLFALFYLHFAPLRKTGRAVSPQEAIGGAFAFLAPLLPFLAWSLCARLGVHFGQPAFEGGRGSEVASTYLHFLKSFTAFPVGDILWQTPKIFEALPVGLVGLLMLGFIPREGVRKELWRVMLVCAAFGAIPFSYYFVAPIGYRYGMPLYLPLVVAFALSLESARGQEARLKVFSLVGGALIIFSLALLRASQEGSRSPDNLPLLPVAMGLVAFLAVKTSGLSWKANRWFLVALGVVVCSGGVQRLFKGFGFFNLVHIPNQLMPTLGQWQSMWRRVYSFTGWTYEEASGRMFYVNHHLEQDPRPSYESTEKPKVLPDDELPFIEGRPHGFFVSIQPLENVPPLKWLLAANIQYDIKRALSDGSLEVGNALFSGGITLIPYWVKDESILPRSGIHNNGVGYYGGNPGVPPEGALSFRWNNCPGKPAYCDLAATVSVSPAGANKWRARVKLEGAPLSQSSPWINPEWTENLQKPYLEIGCGKDHSTVLLGGSVGYNRRFGVKRQDFPFNYNNSILAPFEREFIFPCSRRPGYAAFGAQAVEVDSIRRVSRLPAFRFEGKL